MKIGCAVLAGGKSSRMGIDKAVLPIGGEKFLDKLTTELSCFDEKIIVRGNHVPLPAKDWITISDCYPNCGPIGGIHAALSFCQSDALFFAACDMPFLKYPLAEFLCRELEQLHMNDSAVDAVILLSGSGQIQPLCGIYKKSILSTLEQQISLGDFKLKKLLDRLHTKYIPFPAFLDEQELQNINTPEEYEQIIMSKDGRTSL